MKPSIEQLKDDEKADIDLHGLTVDEAEMRLIEFLNGLPKTVRAVCVAHGFKHGTRLKNMVKNDFYHWRVAGKRVGLNPGATWLILK